MIALFLMSLLLPAFVAGSGNGTTCLDEALDRARAYYDHPRCVHGLSCGDGCDGGSYVWKDDALDLACHEHKRCLERAHEAATTDRCQCHVTLRAFAAAVVADVAVAPPAKKCKWWEFLWCHDDDSAPPPAANPLQPLVEPCLTVIAGLNVQLIRDACV